MNKEEIWELHEKALEGIYRQYQAALQAERERHMKQLKELREEKGKP